jgi:hypothetical protein
VYSSNPRFLTAFHALATITLILVTKLYQGVGCWLLKMLQISCSLSPAYFVQHRPWHFQPRKTKQNYRSGTKSRGNSPSNVAYVRVKDWLNPNTLLAMLLHPCLLNAFLYAHRLLFLLHAIPSLLHPYTRCTIPFSLHHRQTPNSNQTPRVLPLLDSKG